MGGAIARRMLRFGVPLVVYDIDPATLKAVADLGARPATSVRDVADTASLVIVCVPTGGNADVTREACRGSAIEVYAELSTMQPKTMQELAEIAADAGVPVVDAPVSGGVAIAERGGLSLMMAGPETAMCALEDAMSCVTSHVFRIGDRPGQAQMCKLVNNAIGFTLFVASCEALSVGAAGGIDSRVLLRAVNCGSGRNHWTAEKFGPHVLSRTFDAGGKLGGGPRALDLYLDEATAAGMPPGLVARTRALWAKIAELRDPTEDFTNMIKYFEGYTGARLKGGSVR